ncbi:MAG: MATE family efflux transporter, partial [Clostridia bacterium]|nr:MATE family efflux transporter [Clostridia bacterium]
AGQWDRIRKGMTSAAVLSVATSMLISAVMLIFGREITMLFIESDVPEIEAAAGDTAYLYLAVMSAFLAVLYLLHAYRSALQGMGNTFIPMVSGIIEFVMRVGVAAVIGMTGYENGIFFAEVAAWAGAAVILMISYYRSAAVLGKK